MKLHLRDPVNNRDEYLSIENSSYEAVWDKIDDITEKYQYNCTNYLTPILYENEKLVIIHWMGVFDEVPSAPYIELEDCTESFLRTLKIQLKKYGVS